MQFRLVYEGELRSGNSKNNTHIHKVRSEFHKQLSTLWRQPPLVAEQSWRLSPHWPLPTDDKSHPLRSGQPLIGVGHVIGGFSFTALVSPLTEMLADLDILLLRPAPPGALFKDGGDIDNRIKTLIDALRLPTQAEIPKGWTPSEDEKPFDCLLSDDKLVSAFGVRTDRLLKPNAGDGDVMIVVTVTLTASRVTMNNLSLVT